MSNPSCSSAAAGGGCGAAWHPVVTHTLGRETFLRALSGNPASARAADRVISERADDPS